MTEQLTLFNFAPQQTIKTVHDPYWDEIVLSPGAVEETGQLTLLYDDTTEPPDPDDYPSREAFNKAWDEWEKKNPTLATEVRAMSDEDECDRNHFVLEHKGFVGELFIKNSAAQATITHNGKLCLTAENTVENARNWFYQEVEDLISHGVGEQVNSNTQKVAPQHDTPTHPKDQVSLDNFQSAVPYECVGEQVSSNTQKVAPQHDTPTHWVEEYWVERGTNKYWYYRYMYMTGRKLHRIYIGSVNSVLARRKKQAVVDAIADGQTPSEIEKIIKGRE